MFPASQHDNRGARAGLPARSRLPLMAAAITLLLAAHPAPGAPASPEEVAGMLSSLRDGARLVIPPGTYRVCDTKLRNIEVTGVSGAEIDATGVNLIFKPGQNLFFRDCRDIRLTGLTVDYDPLPFAQGTIRRIDAGTKEIEVEPDKDSVSPAALPRRNPHSDALLYFVFDPETLSPRPLLWEGFRDFSEGDNSLWRFAGPTSNAFFGELGRPTAAKEGDKIVIFTRGGPAIHLRGCAGFELSKVTVHASASYAFWEEDGEGGHRYKECRIVRPPGSGRLLTTAADGFHSYLVRRGPLIEGCTFEDTADDTIAVHGFFSVVTGRSADGALQLVSPFGADFAAGEKLEFYAMPHGKPLGTATVRAVRDAAAGESEAAAGRFAVWAKERLRTRKIPDMKVREVELEEKIELPADAMVLASCRALSGNGAAVKNTVIRRGHKRGILIKADDVLVEGNTLEDVAGASVLIEPELFFLEGLVPRGVVIRDNTVTRSGWRSMNHEGNKLGLGGAIEIRTLLARRQFPAQLDPYPLMENFTVEGNTLRDSGTYALVVGNVRGAQIRDNVIDGAFRRPAAAGSPGLARAFDAEEHEAGDVSDPAARAAAVLVFGSEDVAFSGNKIEAGEGIEPVAVGPWSRGVTGLEP